MTIMTSTENKNLATAVSRASTAPPRSRREASHLDHAELASKLISTEGLQMEKERKRNIGDEDNGVSMSKKKSKKRKKEIGSRFVKVYPIPIGATPQELRSFFCRIERVFLLC